MSDVFSGFVSKFVLAAAAAPLALASASAQAQTQDYPSRPVKIVATFTQGGAADATARLFAEKLAERWKQPVYVDTKIGGGGVIGAEFVQNAAPDGYTLLLATNTHVISQVLLPKMPYDFGKDFTPIALTTATATLLAVNKSIPATNLKELTAMFKAAPGKYQYTACNMASPQQFAMEMYKFAVGVDAQNIPYKGCGPAVVDLLGGQINIAMASVTSMAGHVKTGKLTPIVVMSSQRSPTLPNVPTVSESGIPELKGMSFDNYYGFMAPPGTPPAIQKKLEADILAVAKSFETPAMKERLLGAGLEPFVMNSTEMMKQIRSDIVKLGKLAKDAKIEAQ